MDPLLRTVTIVALTLAVGMSWLAVRLLRADRRRRDARVAALEAAAWDSPDQADALDAPGDDDAIDVAPAPSWSPGSSGPTWPSEDDLPVHTDFAFRRDAAAMAPMFAATEEPRAPRRRWLALAAVVLVMAGVGGALYVTLRPAPVGAAATPTPPASTSNPPAAAPLELLSLKHVIADDSLTVTGLVQNPRTGATLASVTAVVYVFDASGAFSASARAPIEFRGMRPGEESPFVVRVPHAGGITRYRVGFRDDTGRVIAHVDHRGQQPVGMTEGR